MESCKCCVHCRGESIARGYDELHEDCPYVSRDKPSSSGKHAPGCSKSRRIFEDKQNGDVKTEAASCYDKFALAKRLHAENLQHQPLPDRVDDSVFKRGCRSCLAKWDAKYRERANAPTKDYPFGPALGCKKPKTRMDLAICWETPIDPVYEPRRSTHIDGSEGGSAPAIFALIQHTPAPRNREVLTRDDECDGAKREPRKAVEEHASRSCCSHFGDASHVKGPSRSAKSSKSVRRVTEQKCIACRQKQELEQREKDPRLIRSAVGIALGLEKDRRAMRDDDDDAKRLSPARTITVPRPRTPFARRAFCIDTLSPPFSVRKGCRDTDYPEHWRLLTMYQQSYRNPHKRRTRYF